MNAELEELIVGMIDKKFDAELEVLKQNFKEGKRPCVNEQGLYMTGYGGRDGE